MKKILVTGANGQLGCEIKQLCKQLDLFELILTDYDELDICNTEAVNLFIFQHKPFAVVNCAAYTAVDKAEAEQDKAMRLNADAVKNLTMACKAVDSFFIHISTDYVFDGKGHKPYQEDEKPSPTSIYGNTKLEGERNALSYPKAIVIRTAWLYSCYGANFVKTMLRLGEERDSLGVVFDQIGSPTFARDLAAAIIAILQQTKQNSGNFKAGIYHYSNEGVCSWYDFARKVMELGNRECQVSPIETKDYPTPAQRPHYSVLNKSKIKSTFTLTIPHWEDSLKDCINILVG